MRDYAAIVDMARMPGWAMVKAFLEGDRDFYQKLLLNPKPDTKPPEWMSDPQQEGIAKGIQYEARRILKFVEEAEEKLKKTDGGVNYYGKRTT